MLLLNLEFDEFLVEVYSAGVGGLFWNSDQKQNEPGRIEF